MTGRDTRPAAHIWTEAAPGEGSPVDTPLPQASVGGMAGLLEILVGHGGREDLPKLAHELTFEVDDLLPLVDAAQVLALAEVDDADIHITDEGRIFVAADILESKQIFAQAARERAPLVRPSTTPCEQPTTATWAKDSSLISFAEDSPRMRPASNPTSPSTGAATESSSISTPTPANSPWTTHTYRTTAESRPARHLLPNRHTDHGSYSRPGKFSRSHSRLHRRRRIPEDSPLLDSVIGIGDTVI